MSPKALRVTTINGLFAGSCKACTDSLDGLADKLFGEVLGSHVSSDSDRLASSLLDLLGDCLGLGCRVNSGQ